MLAVTELALVVSGVFLLVPVLTVLSQCLASLPELSFAEISEGSRPRVSVLVPAHNEELVIAETLASICSQLNTGDRLIVIADNCTDRTADIARSIGAEVTRRSDPTLRGKGYALDHGLKFLEKTGFPETVVIIDADCQLERGCIDRLSRMSAETKRPTQATYLMNRPHTGQKLAALVAFAWKVKDCVRPLGWHRLGLPCQLAGSGMAFPWEVIRSAELANGHLVEDLKLGLDLALAGKPPVFCPEAVVTSNVIADGTASYSQRARWEHGSIDTMLRYVPRLLIGFWTTRKPYLLAMALDLGVPPLALLTLLLGAHSALAFAFFCVSGMRGAMLISATNSALFSVAIVAAWWKHGRVILPLWWLAFAPLYAAVKIPLYLKFVVGRQREWIKGERKASAP